MFRLRGFFVVVLLCSAVLWSTSIALAQTPPTPSTWGSIKAMYGVSNTAAPNFKFNGPGTNSIGSSMGIAWPFPGESPDLWYGDDGYPSGGMSGSFCGGARNNTHSGADYYARDLNRYDGSDDGKSIYTGIAGRVVFSGDKGDGYGNTVVIYDASRRVAVRYAHLQSIGVSYNQTVGLRKYIGRVGRTGNVTGPHLHLAAYVNIDHFQRNGDPVIPTLCDNDYYACAVYFFS